MFAAAGSGCRALLHATACVVLLSLLSPAMASVTSRSSVEAGLETYTTRHYNLFTNLEREEAVEYGKHMDIVFEEYARRFGDFRSRRGELNNFYLVRTRQDYVNLMGRMGFDASASGGMFFRGPLGSGLATWTQGIPRERTLSVLQHEGFHQFAAQYIGPSMPVWVNEGLAVYFEQARVINGKLKTGIAEPYRIATIRSAVEKKKEMSFSSLLNISSWQWQEHMLSGSPLGSLQYTESWSIVYFLIHGENGKYSRAFQQYLMLLSKGRSHEQAYAQTFGEGSEPQFEERWRKFLDELEPDDFSLAMERLEFIGEGVAYYHQKGVQIPDTIEGIRKMLTDHQFAMSYQPSHGAPKVVTRASDPEIWTYTDNRGKEHAFELAPPRRDEVLPRIIAPRLHPTPSIQFKRQDDGTLGSALVF